MRAGGPVRESGVVLLTVLVFILISTLAASSLVVVHDTQRRREKEEELLFAGSQIRKAIASYYNTIPPGGRRALPPSFEALLNDPRFPMPLQHLRRLYPDPMTEATDWEPIMGPGGIVGVRSRSTAQPVKRRAFPKEYESFSDAESYSNWRFVIRYP
jgi:type II secretory pathway pseudopilin PulG